MGGAAQTNQTDDRAYCLPLQSCFHAFRQSHSTGPARPLAVTAQSSVCRDDADIGALIKHAGDGRGGVLVMPEVFTTVHRDAIVAAAVRHRVAAVYPDEISTTH